MAVLSVMIALGSARYFALNPNVVAPQFRARVVAHDPWLLTHITGGIAALLLGAFQFPSAFRDRHLSLHRWLGRIYLLAVLVSGVAGLIISPLSFGGPITHFGFGILAVLWLFSGCIAYVRARQFRFRSHSEWMTRNFALTFAAVTLRIWLLLLVLGGFTFLESYRTVAWLSWIPNLLIAELIVARSR